MASAVDICNRALQKLGAKRISALNENSINARACDAAYEAVRDAELRRYRWSFAITRVSIAAEVTPPDWGRGNSFTLPADCLLVIAPYPEADFNDRDWVIEEGCILTNDSAPLEVRYIKKVTDANAMDSLFREVLACRLAYELCEEITQSNTKKADLKQAWKDEIEEAKKSNSIETVPVVSVEDSWITGRS